MHYARWSLLLGSLQVGWSDPHSRPRHHLDPPKEVYGLAIVVGNCDSGAGKATWHFQWLAYFCGTVVLK